MLTLLASRTLARLVAITSAVVLWLSLSPTNAALSTTPFSDVLDELRSAKSLQLKIRREGRSADVWVRSPGLVRREESRHRYQIAAGSRLWQVDESENSVLETDSPWFIGPQQQVDLLSLLDLGVTGAARLLDAKPVEQIKRDGRELLVYRIALPTAEGNLDVEATADAKSLQLVEILAWKSGVKRSGPPLAEMQLVAMNVPMADEKFAVTKSLTEGGRIGTISDAQGIVVLRPMLAKRWTPICRDTLLWPGDWIRTELRGANAIKVRLSSETELTLGPGTLVECISPTEARLHSGMVQVMVPEQTAEEKPAAKPWTFSLLALRENKRSVKIGEKVIVRVDRDEKLADVAQTPPWLAGFEGTSNNESLGSLIVTMPDGRNEPLTVGYHKVSVEIRDQIARTTIEESFVNNTASRLEGIFHFPLPQDASISGFGMWIGNDLIEADVVEKQRAREIYETFLRKKRDPGLLEWTGGDIFKARVFPIEARSEKRIKIVYTQVLPLRANRYRYSYGLRSELLRTSPLRELSLTVTVNSALGLKSVTCPTHAARTQLTEHSAQVEFAAQEYAPSRDFEVVCEIDGRQNDVVVIPHQRGEDGYFLVQLTPPSPDGNWQREVLPDGDPLSIVLLCDTSMSMDSEKRREQADFVAAVLASLGPHDRFQLGCCDVTTEWATSAVTAVNADTIAAAEKFLSDRVSLGWTNLDAAFEVALKTAPPNAHIVYVGDGILSAGDTDPAAFVKRLAVLRSRILETSGAGARGSLDPDLGQIGLQKSGSLHAVTVGNSNDSVVMRGIATVGGGSVRSISGEQTPQIAALEFLNEIAQPGLRDLHVEFRGVKVAAVYPEMLPNIAAGTQQILVGRYLPEGGNQQGEIVVTGKRGGEEVKYVAKFTVPERRADGRQPSEQNAATSSTSKVTTDKDSEGLRHSARPDAENSFIPRLWARAHLDHLLAQGSNEAIQRDIIRLSEEFHIITPYTSLLVLESDADRERFAVQRRYEMRDGERFFANGRDNANFELVQQQMEHAGDWRVGLRREVLNRFENFGNDSATFEQQLNNFKVSKPMNSVNNRGWRYKSLNGNDWGFGGGGGVGGGGAGGFMISGGDKVPSPVELFLADNFDDVSGSDVSPSVSKSLAIADSRSVLQDHNVPRQQHREPADSVFDGLFDERTDGTPMKFGTMPTISKAFHKAGSLMPGFGEPDETSWIKLLFPELPATTVLPTFRRSGDGNTLILRGGSRNQGADKLHPLPGCSPEAIELANSLLRTESLRAMDGGIELRRYHEFIDSSWNRTSEQRMDLVLYSPTAWLTRGPNFSGQTIVNFCDDKERGIYSLAFRLGQMQPSTESDLTSPQFWLDDFSLLPLYEWYDRNQEMQGTVEPVGDDQVRLMMTRKNSNHTIRFTIDTVRHVILKQEQLFGGEISETVTFDSFVEIAGTWWAHRKTRTGLQGPFFSTEYMEIRYLTQDEYAQRMQQELVDKPTVQFVSPPLAELKDIRQRVAERTVTFDDRLALILHHAQSREWDEMWKNVAVVEKRAADKPGVRWIRTLLLAAVDQNEEAGQRLVDEAKQLASTASSDEVFLAEFILRQARIVFAVPEFQALPDRFRMSDPKPVESRDSAVSDYYDLHQLLKPVYERPLADRVPAIPALEPTDAVGDQRMRDETAQRNMALWNDREPGILDQLGRRDLALPVWRASAEQRPWAVSLQITYAYRLEIFGRLDEAIAWIRQALAQPEQSEFSKEYLRNAVAEALRRCKKWDDLQKWTTEWISRNPNLPAHSGYFQHLSVYSQHLSAMQSNGQSDAAYELARQWLREDRVNGKMNSQQWQRFHAALSFANTDGELGLYSDSIDERWFEPLAETVAFLVRHQQPFENETLVSRCMFDGNFRKSKAADRLRGEFLTMLRIEAATLTMAQLDSIILTVLSDRKHPNTNKVV